MKQNRRYGIMLILYFTDINTKQQIQTCTIIRSLDDRNPFRMIDG